MSRTTTTRLRFGFTYVDLLVVLLLVCLLAAYAFSAGGIMKARESSNRARCASNLRQIGQAMLMYANENKGNYPRTTYAGGEGPTQYTGVACKDPFKKEGQPKANDVTALMFLLVRTQDLPVQSFVCPSTDAAPVAYGNINELQGMANFKSEEFLTYSMNNPYFSKEATETGAKWNTTLGADFVLAGDMNPGKVDPADVTKADPTSPAAEQRRANSLNHRQEGQTLLYGDGHTEFQTTPFAGVRRDNVYTVSGSRDGSRATSTTIEGSPAWAGDSVLLPVATANPHKKTPAEEEAAAVAALKKDLPGMKAQVAQAERRMGPTAQVMRMKHGVEELERELAEYEAKQRK